MSDLKDMPVVTVEQIVRFREKAIETEKQVAILAEKLMKAAGKQNPVTLLKALMLCLQLLEIAHTNPPRKEKAK